MNQYQLYYKIKCAENINNQLDRSVKNNSSYEIKRSNHSNMGMLYNYIVSYPSHSLISYFSHIEVVINE